MRILITTILLLATVFHLNTAKTEKKNDLRKAWGEKDSLNVEKTIIDDIIGTIKTISTKKDSNRSNRTHIKPVKNTFDGVVIEEKIRTVLSNEGIDPFVIELLVAQSKHESGNYRNSLTPYNNVFARHYFKADTFAISAGATAEGHSRFAKYPSVEYATLSQLWYFKRKNYSFKWKSTYEFAAECKRKGYYEAPLRVYVNALNRYMN
jgi:hypothetical protein